MMKLKKGTPRSGSSSPHWDTQYPIGYALHDDAGFDFYPAKWIGPADKPDYTFAGTTSAYELLRIIVRNGVGVHMYSYTVVGQKKDGHLSPEAVEALFESEAYEVRLVTKWANKAAKAHFVFEPVKEAPAKKAPAKKAPAKKALQR